MNEKEEKIPPRKVDTPIDILGDYLSFKASERVLGNYQMMIYVTALMMAKVDKDFSIY